MNAPSVMQTDHPLVLIGVASLCAACAGGPDNRGSADLPMLTDVLTLETAIEGDPTLGEFQVFLPRDIGVDAAGNLYLADDHTLKVYHRDGTPWKQIGRAGSGPGEFAAPLSVTIGPRGHIAAMDMRLEANIYAPDGEFLYRISYLTENRFQDYLQAERLSPTMLNGIVALDADHLLIDLFGMKNELLDPYVVTAQLLYATQDTIRELCQYVDRSTIRIDQNRNSTRGVDFQGDLLWALASSDRLIYTHTFADREENDEHSSYQLIVLDLITRAADTLTVPWERVPIPSEVRNIQSIYVEQTGRTHELDPAVRDILRDTEFYPPLKALRVDQETVFGFHFAPTESVGRGREHEDLEGESLLVDIVDLTTGQLRARAEFPFLPDVIRDGMAYRLSTPSADFPAVQAYRIAESLYRGG